MSQPERETVCFVIEGDWLTDLVRSLWADEGEPEKALKILNTAFPTMQDSDIMAIMIGEKKLIGDSSKGCDLVADGVTESKHGNPLSVASVISRFREKLEDRNDWIEMAVDRTTKIASPEGLVAIPTRRLKAYKKGDITLEDIPYRKIKTFSITPEVRTPIEDELPEPKPRPYPKPSPVIDNIHGWLSPEGKFYSCEYSGHIRLADELGFEEWRLEELQWIKITAGDCFAPENGKPSQKQRDMIFDWFTKRDKKLPWWFNDED